MYLYTHKKPGRYLLSEFYIKAINVKCKNHDALVLFYYSSMLNFHPKGKKKPTYFVNSNSKFTIALS